MPPVSLNVKQQMSYIIKRFKFEELESAVFPHFPELDWDAIKSSLVRNHESLTTPHVLRLMQEEINSAKLSNNTLKDRLAILEVMDVSRHFKKKMWYGYQFKEKLSDPPTLEELEERVKENFHIYHMDVDVRCVEQDNLIFLSVKDRPKKKQRRTLAPTYFAIVKNEDYYFCCKKLVLKNALKAVTQGMGYRGLKKLKLLGKDLEALVQMLMARKAAEAEGGYIKPALQFRQAPPKETILGLDFTQQRQRKEHAEKCFGENAPKFEFLRVRFVDQPWAHPDAAKISNKTINTGLEFRSSTSIPHMLTHLVTHGILQTPLPCYAANLLTIGRNDLLTKPDD